MMLKVAADQISDFLALMSYFGVPISLGTSTDGPTGQPGSLGSRRHPLQTYCLHMY